MSKVKFIVAGVSEDDFISALRVSIGYSDLLYRLKISRNDYLLFYNHFTKGEGGGHISYELLGYLKDIDGGKTVENNFKYMVARQYQDLKSLDIQDIIDEEDLIKKAKTLSSFNDYCVSDEEIIERAKAVGIRVRSTDELLDEARINILKNSPSKVLNKQELYNYIKPYEVIFDISAGYLIYLAKIAGLDVIY